MKQLLTANVAENLYWLGRHIGRVEMTLFRVMGAYDLVIDVDKDAGVKLYDKFSVALNYTGALDFLHQAILGDHDANLKKIVNYARENAIISRNHIGQDAFGEIIALDKLFQNISKSPMLIDYKTVDNAQSLMSEIWGEFSKREHKKQSDYFIRLGKLVEEVDFYFRFDGKSSRIANIVNDIQKIINILSEKKTEISEEEQSHYTNKKILTEIEQTIDTLIVKN